MRSCDVEEDEYHAEFEHKSYIHPSIHPSVPQYHMAAPHNSSRIVNSELRLSDVEEGMDGCISSF